MSKHTPGRWEVRIESEAAQPYCVKSDDYHIATVYMNTPGDTAANARLIAAAPEMYWVLQWIVGSRCTADDNHLLSVPIGWVNYARAILAKIEGE